MRRIYAAAAILLGALFGVAPAAAFGSAATAVIANGSASGAPVDPSVAASITPGAGWLTDSNGQGVDNSGNGSISGVASYAATAPAGLSYTGYVPQESTTPHGSGSVSKVAVNFNEPASMWYEPSSVRSACVFGGINNRQGFDHVDFILEGTVVTVSQETWDSRTHMGGWCIKPLSPVGKDGNAVLYARVVPVNGLERVIALPMVLDTNASITRWTCYLNPQTVGASDTGDAATTKCAPGSPGGIDKPFMSYQYAAKHVPSGANVLMAGGTGTACGQAGFYCEKTKGGGNSGGTAIGAVFTIPRMITFKPDPAISGTVTISRGDALVVNSSPVRYMGASYNNANAYDNSFVSFYIWGSKVQFSGITFDMSAIPTFACQRTLADIVPPYATYPEDMCVFGPNVTLNDPYGPFGAGASGASYSSPTSSVDPTSEQIFNGKAGQSIYYPYGGSIPSAAASPRYALIESTVSNYTVGGAQLERNTTETVSWEGVYAGQESSNMAFINKALIQAGNNWSRLEYDDNNFVTGTPTFDGTYTSIRLSYDAPSSGAVNLGAPNTLGGSIIAFITGGGSSPIGSVTTHYDPVSGLTTATFSSTPTRMPVVGDTLRLPNATYNGVQSEGEREFVYAIVSTSPAVVQLQAPFAGGDITTPTPVIIDPSIQLGWGGNVNNGVAGTMTTVGTAVIFSAAGPAVGDTIGYNTNTAVNLLEMHTLVSMSDSTHGVLDNAFTAGSLSTATNYYKNLGFVKVLGNYTSVIAAGDKVRGHNVAHPDIGQWSRRSVPSPAYPLAYNWPNPENLTWLNYKALGKQVQTFEMQNGCVSHIGAYGACYVDNTVAISSVGVDGNGNQTITFSADAHIYYGDLILDEVSKQQRPVIAYNSTTFTATLSQAFATTPSAGDAWIQLKTYKDGYIVNSVMGKFSPDGSVGHFDETGMNNWTIAQSTTVGASTLVGNSTPFQSGAYGMAFFDSIWMQNLGNGSNNYPASGSSGSLGAAISVTSSRYTGACDPLGNATDSHFCVSGNVIDSQVDIGDSIRLPNLYANSPSTGMALDSQYRPLANISRPMIGNTITGKPLEPWDCFGNPITTSAVVGACH